MNVSLRRPMGSKSTPPSEGAWASECQSSTAHGLRKETPRGGLDFETKKELL